MKHHAVWLAEKFWSSFKMRCFSSCAGMCSWLWELVAEMWVRITGGSTPLGKKLISYISTFYSTFGCFRIRCNSIRASEKSRTSLPTVWRGFLFSGVSVYPNSSELPRQKTRFKYAVLKPRQPHGSFSSVCCRSSCRAFRLKLWDYISHLQNSCPHISFCILEECIDVNSRKGRTSSKTPLRLPKGSPPNRESLRGLLTPAFLQALDLFRLTF